MREGEKEERKSECREGMEKTEEEEGERERAQVEEGREKGREEKTENRNNPVTSLKLQTKLKQGHHGNHTEALPRQAVPLETCTGQHSVRALVPFF